MLKFITGFRVQGCHQWETCHLPPCREPVSARLQILSPLSLVLILVYILTPWSPVEHTFEGLYCWCLYETRQLKNLKSKIMYVNILSWIESFGVLKFVDKSISLLKLKLFGRINATLYRIKSIKVSPVHQQNWPRPPRGWTLLYHLTLQPSRRWSDFSQIRTTVHDSLMQQCSNQSEWKYKS